MTGLGQFIVLLVVAVSVTAQVRVRTQPAATLPIERLLTERLGMAAADVARVTAGEAVVWKVPGNTGNEVAAAGVVRAKGDMRRLVAWLRDIEAFMRAAGVVNVGAISNPVTPADFTRLSLNDADFADLASCRPGRCEIRMPAAYLDRFQREVAWKQPDAQQQAVALAKTLIGDYVAAYQKGGDAALGAHHNQKAPNQIALEFQDMLRRATRVWDLAYPFANYLETFPKGRPESTEDRFYWTRDTVGLKPALTLHHVALQEFSDGRVLVADKQIYASRQIDTGLMIALGVPKSDRSGFDLLVSVKARADAMAGITGRVLRERIENEVVESLKIYLVWIRASSAL
jgi:hypothetical protein